MNYLRTAILLAGLTALFMGVGWLIGGQSGMWIAFLLAAGMNLFSYWNSDKLALAAHGAQPVDERTAPDLVRLVAELARNAGLPMPKVYLIDNPQPNAFATGRNPQNAAVAVTTGLVDMLSREEVAGVMAHELAHIKNRDTLIMTITATIAGAISILANFAQFGMMFGGNRDNGHSNPLGWIGVIVAIVVAPLAAMIVQMAISRTREYAADRAGGLISGDPLALASALEKISGAARHIPNLTAEAHPNTAHLFIVNPLSGRGFDNLFSTHPNPENRIAALVELAREIGGARAPRAPFETGPAGWVSPDAGPRPTRNPWNGRRDRPWG